MWGREINHYDGREEGTKYSGKLKFGIIRIFSLQNNFRGEIMNKIKYKTLLNKSDYER